MLAISDMRTAVIETLQENAKHVAVSWYRADEQLQQTGAPLSDAIRSLS